MLFIFKGYNFVITFSASFTIKYIINVLFFARNAFAKGNIFDTIIVKSV
jgi:hypothetical protein